MCAIAGILTPHAERYRSCLDRMLAVLQHRGPDGKGTALFEKCALGHNRLAIVDLTKGNQPMFSRSRCQAIVFNGEIYGYQQIRRDIPAYPYATTSDTEVILALYDRDRVTVLENLPGMFAFALWDENRQELWGARDRFGEKPLYYAFGRDGEFLFASEIKGILASGLVDPVLDIASLIFYLERLYVRPDRTIYQNIHTLPPGFEFSYDLDRGLRLKRYWELPSEQVSISLADAVEEFRRLLDHAVAKQLVADVPVGAFLSGGLDSSTIVALASRHRPALKTFSFGFSTSIDELPYARGIARRYRTKHIELGDSEENIAALLMKMREIYDEPFADSSNIPMYLIAKKCREHTRVVLSGDGADELLGGYSFWYRSLFDMERTARYPERIRALIKFILLYSAKLPFPESVVRRILGIQKACVLNQQYMSVLEAHRARTAYFQGGEITRLLDAAYGSEDLAGQEGCGQGGLEEVLRQDLTGYMPGDILVKTDRATMAHGLELRSPYLDRDFAEFCIRLPLSLKITSSQDKRILRESFSESWTPEIRRRGKQGFGAPVADWLAGEPVKELVNEYLRKRNRKIFSILSYNAAQSFLDPGSYKTWILLVLALWMEKQSFRQTAVQGPLASSLSMN